VILLDNINNNYTADKFKVTGQIYNLKNIPFFGTQVTCSQENKSPKAIPNRTVGYSYQK